MDHLSKSLARQISLKQGEDVPIAADHSFAVPDSTDHALYLVGRVVIDKELSLNALRANIRRLLNPVKGVDIRPLGSNKVLLKFDHPLDRKHALDGCPWAVERHALLLEPPDLAIEPEKQKLEFIPIVVRILHLSQPNRSESVAKLIGNSL